MDIARSKIGIIGVGTVGGAIARYFESRGLKPLLYDKYKKLGLPQDVNKADIIFISVPTPFDSRKKRFDDQYLREAFQLLRGSKIVVIKSTVLPGTTMRFQKLYPKHKILFNPEFLRESSPDRDFRKPDRQIIGYTPKSKYLAKKVLQLLPRASYQAIMPATAAEVVKYFGNNFLAVKVAFANLMYDLCSKIGVDYNRVAEAVAQDKRIGFSHLDVWHGGYRGYAGKCFPKDIKAMIVFADSLGLDFTIHKAAEKVNNKLLRMQKIKDPEKLSTRESA